MPRVLFVVLAFGCSGFYEPEPLMSPTSAELELPVLRAEQLEALRSVGPDFTVIDRAVPLALDEHVVGADSVVAPVLAEGGRDYVREWAAVALRRA